jgi:hypothetical protein
VVVKMGQKKKELNAEGVEKREKGKTRTLKTAGCGTRRNSTVIEHRE